MPSKPEPMTETQPRPGLPTGIHSFGRDPLPLAEVVTQARGLRDRAREQAAKAAESLKHKADVLDALLTEADGLAGNIESAKTEVRRGEERLAGLTEFLGGDDPNVSATLGRCIDGILDSVERTFHPQPHDVLGLVQVEALVKHRAAILAAAEARWLTVPRQRLRELEGRLKEIETAIGKAAEEAA